MIEFACCCCGAPIRVSKSLAGRRGSCLTCGCLLRIPLPKPAEDMADLAGQQPDSRRGFGWRVAPSVWIVFGVVGGLVLLIVLWEFVLALIGLFIFGTMLSGLGGTAIRTAIRHIR